MSRTKELLYEQFAEGEWDEIMENLNTDISPSICKAMEKYARECCEASLKQAFEKSLFDWNTVSKNYAEQYKNSIINHKNIILL